MKSSLVILDNYLICSKFNYIIHASLFILVNLSLLVSSKVQSVIFLTIHLFISTLQHKIVLCHLVCETAQQHFSD